MVVQVSRVQDDLIGEEGLNRFQPHYIYVVRNFIVEVPLLWLASRTPVQKKKY